MFFLSKDLRLPKKLDLQRAPLSNSVAILVAMSIFTFIWNLSIREVLDVV